MTAQDHTPNLSSERPSRREALGMGAAAGIGVLTLPRAAAAASPGAGGGGSIPPGSPSPVNLTGDPEADGFTPIGYLWDTDKWVFDTGAGTNARLFARVWNLGSTDTGISKWGETGGYSGNDISKPEAITSLVGYNSTWQLGDRILAIGIVSLAEGAVRQRTVTMKFDSDGNNAGVEEDNVWRASTGPRPSNADGRSSGTTGTSPGDMRTWQFNGNTAVAWSLPSGSLQFKNSSNANASVVPDYVRNIGLNFFRGTGVNDKDLDRGETLLNLSAIARWAATPSLGGYTNPSNSQAEAPDAFASSINFVIQVSGTNNEIDTASNVATESVFFGISTQP